MDQGSKLCTPVKEMETLKILPSQNRYTDDEIENHFEGVKRDEARCSGCEQIQIEKILVYQKEESQKAETRLMHAYEQWKAEA